MANSDVGLTNADLEDKAKRIRAFNALVHRLPRVNLSLLKALSQFLMWVVDNSNKNKMTVRNVGIVFSPTLNIPAPVFSMFLQEYDSIFGPLMSDDVSTTLEMPPASSLSAEDIRSPRRQIFSDLPTPAYHQTSFQQDSTRERSHERPHGAADMGLIPLQPSYEPTSYSTNPRVARSNELGFNAPHHMPLTRKSSSAGSAALKAKRRESSMLMLNMGPGNPLHSVALHQDCKYTQLLPRTSLTFQSVTLPEESSHERGDYP